MSCPLKSDEEILSVLGKCNSYAEKRVELSKKLSAGFFQMAMARKHGKLSLSADDLREDFDARVRVEVVDGGGFRLIEDELQTQSDDLVMFTALPPPALRRAQGSFVESLQLLLSLAELTNSIRDETK
jgi:vacuolar-type H+-ATPase subunit D/Vma8